MNAVLPVLVACFMFSGCATPQPVVPPPEIVEVPKYIPLPPECGVDISVDLPPGSSAADVMAKQKKALNEARSQIKRCFRPAEGAAVRVGSTVGGLEP